MHEQLICPLGVHSKVINKTRYHGLTFEFNLKIDRMCRRLVTLYLHIYGTYVEGKGMGRAKYWQIDIGHLFPWVGLSGDEGLSARVSYVRHKDRGSSAYLCPQSHQTCHDLYSLLPLQTAWPIQHSSANHINTSQYSLHTISILWISESK